ncbi:hypothetical protein ACROYT_G008481 [Oculina patagonica]
MQYPEQWPWTSAMTEVLEPGPEPRAWRKANKRETHKNKIHTPLHEHKLKKAQPFSDFDICLDCFEPRRHPVHNHKLNLVDTSLIYGKTAGGRWVCGVCGNTSRPNGTFSHHCTKCDFDVCHDCFKPHITPLHGHPLYRADTYHVYGRCNGDWKCDNCYSYHSSPTDNRPWHCQICEFDLCRDCACVSATIEATEQAGPSPENSSRNRRRFKRAARSANPWVARDHLMPTSAADATPSFVTEEQNVVGFPEDADDSSVKCIICLEQPKNATLIHGDTGHCCSCWACAIVLKQRGDPCPVCRAPIKQVIRQFIA